MSFIFLFAIFLSTSTHHLPQAVPVSLAPFCAQITIFAFLVSAFRSTYAFSTIQQKEGLMTSDDFAFPLPASTLYSSEKKALFT